MSGISVKQNHDMYFWTNMTNGSPAISLKDGNHKENLPETSAAIVWFFVAKWFRFAAKTWRQFFSQNLGRLLRRSNQDVPVA
jgi:hypothetical protein